MRPHRSPLARILLVDDEPDILHTLAQGLPLFLNSVELDVAANGHEARQRLEKTTYDILITDQKMPGMAGLELVEWVRQRAPRTRCVLMTAYAGGPLREAAKGAGVDLYLEKPFDFRHLAKAVQPLLPATSPA